MHTGVEKPYFFLYGRVRHLVWMKSGLLRREMMNLRRPRTKAGGIPEKWNSMAQERDPVRNGDWLFLTRLAPECNTGLDRSDQERRHEDKA